MKRILCWIMICGPFLAHLSNAADPLDTFNLRRYAYLDDSQNWLNGVAYGNGKFVAVGDRGWIVSSPYGVAWTDRIPATNSFSLSGVVFVNGLFVAVGGSGRILSSTDGLNWVTHNTSTNDYLSGVAYGNGQFVATGTHRYIDQMTSQWIYSGVTFTSINGILWTRHHLPLGLEGVVYGNGIFASGWHSYNTSTTTLISSSDGINWTPQFSSEVLAGNIAFGSGQFVHGGNGSIFTSLDGTNWMAQTLTDHNYAISSANGQFFVSTPYQHAILTSPDASNWTSRSLPSGAYGGPLWFTYGRGTYIGVGIGGLIVQSGSVPEWLYAPIIATHPLSQAVVADAGVHFGVSADGIPPLGYQWRKNGVNIANATNATLTVSNA